MGRPADVVTCMEDAPKAAETVDRDLDDDGKFFNVKTPECTQMVVQERAYTSPIWYTP